MGCRENTRDEGTRIPANGRGGNSPHSAGSPLWTREEFWSCGAWGGLLCRLRWCSSHLSGCNYIDMLFVKIHPFIPFSACILYLNKKLKGEKSPLLYLHRIHGCSVSATVNEILWVLKKSNIVTPKEIPDWGTFIKQQCLSGEVCKDKTGSRKGTNSWRELVTLTNGVFVWRPNLRM